MTESERQSSGTAAPAQVILQRSDVTIRSGPEPGTVTASGSLDMLTSPLLLRALSEALAARPARVRLDLRAVHFIDASTVGVLVKCWREAVATGCDLRVAGATGIVRRVLEITGIWLLVAEEATQ